MASEVASMCSGQILAIRTTKGKWVRHCDKVSATVEVKMIKERSEMPHSTLSRKMRMKLKGASKVDTKALMRKSVRNSYSAKQP